jgi:hypothetical protein
LALSTVAVAQTTFYVNFVIGSDGYDGLSPTITLPATGPKQTIGNAIATASSADIISVDYAGGILYNEAVVVGNGAPTTPGSKELTFVSTNGTPRVVSMTINNGLASPNNTITFTGPFTLTTGLTLLRGGVVGAGNLTMGNGATIVRDGGSLSAVPTFGTSVNVMYVGGGSYVTGAELPVSTTALNNLTLSKSGGVVSLSAPVTVNGTLALGTNNTIDVGASTLTCTGSTVTMGLNSSIIATGGLGVLALNATIPPLTF